jgi:hypothetical protein
MSETRKVCLYAGGTQSACPRHRWPDLDPEDLDVGDPIAVWTAFIALPRQAQCDDCVRTMLEPPMCDHLVLTATPESYHASPAHILSVSLFLAGLSGWLPAAARDLVALVCADPAAVPVLLDLAEDHASGWPRVEVEWPTRDEHGTGDNPHVWLEVHHEWTDSAGSYIAVRDRQCPCGEFESESGMAVREYRDMEAGRFRREYLGQWVPHERSGDVDPEPRHAPRRAEPDRMTSRTARR